MSFDTSDNVQREFFFIWDVKMCLQSHWPIIFTSVSSCACRSVMNWPNIFVNQGQFSDPDFICGTHPRQHVQFADKAIYQRNRTRQRKTIYIIWSCQIVYLKEKKPKETEEIHWYITRSSQKPAITDLIHKGNINANTNMKSLSECFKPNVLFTVKATKLHICWLAGSLDAYPNDDPKLCSFWLCWVFLEKIFTSIFA
jgi:hypothetical protein